MNSRLKKILLWLLAAALLAVSGQVQKSLNRDRQELG
jgi:ABC-type enterobactin transport system permease subunit